VRRPAQEATLCEGGSAIVKRGRLGRLSSGPLQDDSQHAACFFRLLGELMAGRAAEGLEILPCSRISRKNFKSASERHFGDRLFGL